MKAKNKAAVWTEEYIAMTGQGPAPAVVDKGEFRFTVEVPEKDLHYWPAWSNKQGISKAWYDRLATMGNPREWYIVQYPISTDNIKRLENTRTGEVLLDLE